jgi:hypothetical protein
LNYATSRQRNAPNRLMLVLHLLHQLHHHRSLAIMTRARNNKNNIDPYLALNETLIHLGRISLPIDFVIHNSAIFMQALVLQGLKNVVITSMMWWLISRYKRHVSALLNHYSSFCFDW